MKSKTLMIRMIVILNGSLSNNTNMLYIKEINRQFDKEVIKASRTGLVNFIFGIFWFSFFLQLFMLDDPGIKIENDFLSNILVMVTNPL